MSPPLGREGLKLVLGAPLPILQKSMELGVGEALRPVPIQGLTGLGTNFGS